MDFVITGLVAGVVGTLAMDSLNLLCAQTGLLAKIDVRMIGRMAAGWTRGRFRYRHPGEMRQVGNELLYGYLTHYAIGVTSDIYPVPIESPTSPVQAADACSLLTGCHRSGRA